MLSPACEKKGVFKRFAVSSFSQQCDKLSQGILICFKLYNVVPILK